MRRCYVFITRRLGAHVPVLRFHHTEARCACTGVTFSSHGGSACRQVALFKRLHEGEEEGGGTASWTFIGQKRAHSHDVRALAMARVPGAEGTSLLLSGGNDAQVQQCPLPPTPLHAPEKHPEEHPEEHAVSVTMRRTLRP
eukprot:1195636-Prorocentrum_minimum.AAC.2